VKETAKNSSTAVFRQPPALSSALPASSFVYPTSSIVTAVKLAEIYPAKIIKHPLTTNHKQYGGAAPVLRQATAEHVTCLMLLGQQNTNIQSI